MRQLVVLGLLALVGWWVYGTWFAAPAEAAPGAPEAGASAAAKPHQPMAAVVGSAAPERAPERAPDAPLDSARSVADVAEIEAGIARGEPAAVEQGWALLANPGGDQKAAQKVRDTLLAKRDGFDELLAQLGSYNTFLHSAVGREKAKTVLGAAMALPDAEACAAGTKLVGLCLRGPIEKPDAEARAFVDQAYAQLRIRVERWLCDPANVAGARSYTVGAGDSLSKIAGKFRKEGLLVEEGTLAVLNRIHNKNAIQKDQKIKCPADPVHCIVEKRSFSLAVYVGDTLLRLYWVGHGKDDKTPLATFTVAEKQPHPQWTAPDGNVYPYGHPQNILGEYFIKFRHDSYTGFGAHGTPQPETIGTMSSAGCIRMYAPDIAELFEILPRGTKVEIRATAP